MTRKEAHERIESLHINDIQTRGLHHVIDKIYDDFEKKEEAEIKDRLAELEKVILDYYLAKGYQIGVGGWAFNVEINSDYKSKQLLIYFQESKDEHYDQVLRVESETTKEIFDEAIEHFTIKKKV